MRRALVGMAIAGLALSGIGAAQAAQPANDARDAYIVRFVDGTRIGAEAAAAARGGAEVTGTVSTIFPAFFATMTAAQAQGLARNPRVVSVELDGPVRATVTQNNATWGIDRIDQRSLPLSGTYNYGPAGAGVRVYVIDTGVRSAHVDFGGRVVSGFTAFKRGGSEDCNGHGTHVAGTIAGTTWGVAKAATIVPVRVLDCSGSGTWSGVISGMDWVVSDLQAQPSGTAAVANMSLGGSANSSVDAGVGRMTAAGVSVAVAAGNETADACNSSPARAPSAITVGATTSSDVQASFSNFGACVDVYAPGVSITSDWSTSNTATNTISGTSMASPHVAGVAAVLQTGGRLSPAAVTSAIVSNASTGKVTSLGPNSPNLLLYSPPPAPDATAPPAPTVTATRGNGSADISWTSNGDGGAAISSYAVTVSPSLGGAGTTVTVSGSTTSTTVTSLTNGTSYNVSVTATNSAGTSAAGTATVTPATVPGVPTNVTATAGDASASIQWGAPDTGGSAITGYTVTLTGGATPLAQQVSGLSANFTNLVNGTTYSVSVVATNDVGSGSGSTGTSVTPAAPAPPPDSGGGSTPPPTLTLGAPTNVSVSTGGAIGALTITWANGGTATPDAYVASVWTAASGGTRAGTCTWTSGALTCTVTGLARGTTYYVDVTASLGSDTATSTPRVSGRTRK